MTRIDDARAAELDDCELCRGTGEVEVAPQGDLRKSDHYGCPLCMSADWAADRAGYKARIEELEAERDSLMAASQEGGEIIAELRAQLPTPSPTDAPASDTRGLAVEIMDRIFPGGWPTYDQGVDAVEGILRKALPAVEDTARKLADLRAEFDQLAGVLEDRRSELEVAVARAVEALRPFAREAEEWAEKEIASDDFRPTVTADGPYFDSAPAKFTLGDMRRAATIVKDIAPAPAEAERAAAPDIKPIVEARTKALEILEAAENFSAWCPLTERIDAIAEILERTGPVVAKLTRLDFDAIFADHRREQS